MNILDKIVFDKRREVELKASIIPVSQLEKSVLFEQEENEGWLYGFSENYVKVKTPYNEALINQIVAVELTEIDRDGLMKCDILTNFAS
mgnify:CR=1 FL=1